MIRSERVSWLLLCTSKEVTRAAQPHGSFAHGTDILATVKTTRAVMRRIYLTTLLALCATIAACGNKGPLVMPDQKPQTQPQQPAATPAPAQDPGKQ
jgi:predicted small lipoprotein YifL